MGRVVSCCWSCEGCGCVEGIDGGRCSQTPLVWFGGKCGCLYRWRGVIEVDGVEGSSAVYSGPAVLPPCLAGPKLPWPQARWAGTGTQRLRAPFYYKACRNSYKTTNEGKPIVLYRCIFLPILVMYSKEYQADRVDVRSTPSAAYHISSRPGFSRDH